MKMKKILWLAVMLLSLAGEAGAGQKNLIVGMVENPPYAWQSSSGIWQGLFVSAWESTAVSLGLKWEYRHLREAEMIPMTAKKGVDILVAPLCMLPEREALVDFSVPIGQETLSVAVPSRRPMHPWAQAMILFLSWGTLKVLFSLIFLLLLLGSIFWLVEQKHNPENFGGGVLQGLGAGIYWVGATLASGMCMGVSLKSSWGRTLGILWMFACAIALSAFTASLASTLTAQGLEETYVTLSQARHMRLGTVAGDVAVNLMKSYGLPAVEFPDQRNGLAALIAGQIDGFVADAACLRYFAENGCKIDILPVRLKQLPFGFAFPLNSPLRKRVNQALLELMQESKWDSLQRYYGIEPDSPSTRTYSFLPRKPRTPAK